MQQDSKNGSTKEKERVASGHVTKMSNTKRRTLYNVVLPLLVAACLAGLIMCNPSELHDLLGPYFSSVGPRNDFVDSAFDHMRTSIEHTILSFAGDAPPPPPPPLSHVSHKVDTAQTQQGQPDAAHRNVEGKTSTNDTDMSQMQCFTLEAYSDRFLLRDRDKRLWQQQQKNEKAHSESIAASHPPYFFGCGTRVIDLRTEDRPDYRQACSSNNNDGGSTAFASLRVVLTSQELRLHEESKWNVARQRIPLGQFNDDYCDCLDGTDELLTNACSMAGSLTPLAGARWPQYLQANKHAPLYADDLARSAEERLTQRLYSLGGPVLPFRCAHDAQMLLAPSAIGDGIVDCCDASDEAVLQGYPYLTHPHKHHHEGTREKNGITSCETHGEGQGAEAALRDKYAQMIASEREKVLQQQQRRVAQMATHVGNGTWHDTLYPHHTSLAAVLVERGSGGAVMSCAAVKQTRLTSARALYAMVRRGHEIQQQRAAEGWDKLGREMDQSAPRLVGMLANVSAQAAQLKNTLEYAMRWNQLPPAVLERELDRFERLKQHEQELRLNYQINELIRSQHIFGLHYEFYPLATEPMEVDVRDVYSSAESAGGTFTIQPDVATDKKGSSKNDIHVLSQAELRALFAQGPDAVMTRLHINHVVLRRLYVTFIQHLVGVYNASDTAVTHPNNNNNNSYNSGGSTSDEEEEVAMEYMPLGMWRPMQTENTTAGFHLLDAAGDVDLPRRLFMRPFTRLTRGMGKLQWPTRQPEPARFITHSLEEQQSKSQHAALTGDTSAKSARERVQQSERQTHVRVPYFQTTRNVAAVHFFADGVLCGRTANDRQSRTYGRVVYVCDANDTVLRWGRNGRCGHEVVIGTPSACAPWVMHAAEEQLRLAERESTEET